MLSALLNVLNVFLTWNVSSNLLNFTFVSCAGVLIDVSVQKDPTTGLQTTLSMLEYSATKEDTDAKFSCSTQHLLAEELVSPVVTFTITCEWSPSS